MRLCLPHAFLRGRRAVCRYARCLCRPGVQDDCLTLCEALGDASAAQALAAQLGCSSLSALIPCAQGELSLAQSIGDPLPIPLHLGFDFD